MTSLEGHIASLNGLYIYVVLFPARKGLFPWSIMGWLLAISLPSLREFYGPAIGGMHGGAIILKSVLTVSPLRLLCTRMVHLNNEPNTEQ